MIIYKKGKLKGNNRKYIQISYNIWSVVGNILSDKINIKEIIQNRNEIYDQTQQIRNNIEHQNTKQYLIHKKKI